jgi:23S rRNA (pseudouridine1915-N3)-methyltransferase
MITIITVGKQHDRLLRSAIERYEQRLKKPYIVEWVHIPHSLHSGSKAIDEESQRIEKRLQSSDFVLLLDERGTPLSSPQLSQHLAEVSITAKRIVCIIGGAYGVNDRLKKRANLIWSLSNLVFPHQLVRLILIEQLYRAQTIARGEPYHHDS